MEEKEKYKLLSGLKKYLYEMQEISDRRIFPLIAEIRAYISEHDWLEREYRQELRDFFDYYETEEYEELVDNFCHAIARRMHKSPTELLEDSDFKIPMLDKKDLIYFTSYDLSQETLNKLRSLDESNVIDLYRDLIADTFPTCELDDKFEEAADNLDDEIRSGISFYLFEYANESPNHVGALFIPICKCSTITMLSMLILALQWSKTKEEIQKKVQGDSVGLTTALTEVANLIKEGLSMKEIAAGRNVSIETVKTQIKTLANQYDCNGIKDLRKILK